jgi:hypothetical protein
VDDDIRASNESREPSASGIGLRVQEAGALAGAIRQPDGADRPGIAFEHRWFTPADVATRRFDFEDLRAESREQVAAKQWRDARQFEDAQSRKRR